MLFGNGEGTVRLAKGSRIPAGGSWEANAREMCLNPKGSKCRHNSSLNLGDNLEPMKPFELLCITLSLGMWAQEQAASPASPS